MAKAKKTKATPGASQDESGVVGKSEKKSIMANLEVKSEKKKAIVAIPGCVKAVGEFNQEELERLAVIADSSGNENMKSFFKKFPKGIASKKAEENVTEQTSK